MSARRGWGWLGLTMGLGLALQACIAVPVRSHPARSYAYDGYGYGGSGYTEVNPRAAREECVRAARAHRGYRNVRAGGVEQAGPDVARVRLFMGRPFGREYAVNCEYNARTGAAYVP
jgi:hypothetical protein